MLLYEIKKYHVHESAYNFDENRPFLKMGFEKLNSPQARQGSSMRDR